MRRSLSAGLAALALLAALAGRARADIPPPDHELPDYQKRMSAPARPLIAGVEVPAWVEKAWYRSTFPTAVASLEYHWEKHGKPAKRSVVDYTDDALACWEKHKRLAKRRKLQDGTWGVLIRTGPRKPGGYYTADGKIVTFWYR